MTPFRFAPAGEGGRRMEFLTESDFKRLSNPGVVAAAVVALQLVVHARDNYARDGAAGRRPAAPEA
jgi:hypothetical protein